MLSKPELRLNPFESQLLGEPISVWLDVKRTADERCITVAELAKIFRVILPIPRYEGWYAQFGILARIRDHIDAYEARKL